MKRLIIILITTSICFGACLYCYDYVGEKADVLERGLNEIYISAQNKESDLKKEIEKTAEHWKKHKGIFSFVTDHNIIRELDTIILSLDKYEGIDNNKELSYECARGLVVLEEIRESIKFSLSSVL